MKKAPDYFSTLLVFFAKLRAIIRLLRVGARRV
jgi:hypothetical protein